MDIYKLLSLVGKYRKRLLFANHVVMIAACVFLAIAVWEGEFEWFGYYFWSWMYMFVSFTIMHIQLSEEK